MAVPSNTMTQVVPIFTAMVAEALRAYTGAMGRYDASYNPPAGFRGDTIRVPKPDESLAAATVSSGRTSSGGDQLTPTRTTLDFQKTNWISVAYAVDDFELTSLPTGFLMQQARAAAYELMLEVEKRCLRTGAVGAAYGVSAWDALTSGATSSSPLFGKESTTRPLPLMPITNASQYLTAGRAPMSDRHFVLDEARYAGVGAIPEWNRVDYTGQTMVDQTGMLGQKLGFMFGLTQGAQAPASPSNATGTILTSEAGEVGETSITYDGKTGGNFQAGTEIGFGANPRRTFILGNSNPGNTGTFTLNGGLLETFADNTAVKNLNANAPRSLAFHREFMLIGSKWLPDAREGYGAPNVPNALTTEVGPLRIRVTVHRENSQWRFETQCAFACAVHRPRFGVQIVLT